MKKKLTLTVSVLLVAFLGLTVAAFAQEASVFGNDVLIRAYVQCASGCSGGTPLYSAYLQVRDDHGNMLNPGDFRVRGKLDTDTPLDPVTGNPADTVMNPVQIHNNDLTDADISLSYDFATNTVYVFCTSDEEGLHVMTYEIGLTTPVNGVCGSANGKAYKLAPTTNLCSAGQAPPGVSGDGPWTWVCNGLNSGDPSGTCSADKVACGSSNGGTFSTTPPDLCSAGTGSPVVNDGQGHWTWTCSGEDVTANGSVSCSANVQSGNNIDLGITSFSAPTGVRSGSSMFVSATVRNFSSNPAAALTVQFYLGSTLLGTVPVDGLAGGASTTVMASYVVYIPAHSWTTVSVTVVPNSSDTDTNPANNTAKRGISGV